MRIGLVLTDQFSPRGSASVITGQLGLADMRLSLMTRTNSIPARLYIYAQLIYR
jgi:hypothetical protein